MLGGIAVFAFVISEESRAVTKENVVMPTKIQMMENSRAGRDLGTLKIFQISVIQIGNWEKGTFVLLIKTISN